MVMRIAADVAGAARTGPDLMQRLVHRGDDDRVLAHPQVVVGAPHGDRLGPVAAEAAGVGILAAGAQNVDEHAVAALVVKPPDRFLENAIVVQLEYLARAPSSFGSNDSQLGHANLPDAEAGKRRGGRWAKRRREHHEPVGRGRRPRLLASQKGDAPGDARTAVYIADIRERAPKFLLEQRKMGAGKDNGVDSRAIGRLEHWLRPVLNGVDPDRLPGELGFGQLD